MSIFIFVGIKDDDVDSKFLTSLFKAMYDELPEPRKRNKSVIYTGFNVQGECLTG